VAGSRYRIEFAPRAERDFRRLPAAAQRRLAPRIDALAQEPRPPGARAMAGAEGLYRLRVGDYRIVYRVQDRILVVLVLKVGHRREVYRQG
jgi:mRNA interferase RelE/StbE